MNPAKALAKQFLCQSPMTLLGVGVILSGFDFALLYAAAAKESVLFMDQGIGLMNNRGVLSTVIGNAISLYAVRKYYDYVCSIRTSKAVVNPKLVEPSLSALTDMIKMGGRSQFVILSLLVVGLSVWLSNIAFHLFSSPEIRWGHKVFDSLDHPLSFVANRFHNLLTWLLIMPFVVHVMIVTTFQLRRAITAAFRKNSLKYDLLNPDERGGFGFVDKAHIAFNVVVALVYIQFTMHILTFERMNAEHIIGYSILTLALIGFNWIFLGDIYGKIRMLRLESLNELKDRVFDDKLNFEVLKYCLERKASAFSVTTLAIKAVGLVIPILVKHGETIFQSLRK